MTNAIGYIESVVVLERLVFLFPFLKSNFGLLLLLAFL